LNSVSSLLAYENFLLVVILRRILLLASAIALSINPALTFAARSDAPKDTTEILTHDRYVSTNL